MSGNFTRDGGRLRKMLCDFDYVQNRPPLAAGLCRRNPAVAVSGWGYHAAAFCQTGDLRRGSGSLRGLLSVGLGSGRAPTLAAPGGQRGAVGFPATGAVQVQTRPAQAIERKGPGRLQGAGPPACRVAPLGPSCSCKTGLSPGSSWVAVPDLHPGQSA